MTNTNGKAEVENVRVFIRIRPLNKKEIEEHEKDVICVDKSESIISFTNSTNSCKSFRFDQIFGSEVNQLNVYRTVAAPIVEKTLRGYNGTIFAYGQTGTGKTYTMVGNSNADDLKGIIPNAFSHIFTRISRSGGDKSFLVTATYLEIYNEEVRDLLSADPSKKLAIRERPDLGVYIKDLVGFTVDSIESITELLNRGNKNRMTRTTLMNDVSSRSHAIFTIAIESRDRATNKTTIGKLNLVDLAGSERASRTQATGERLREASNINLSLSVLGNVISALVDGKNCHIPYRNSKLTRLLQDSLGGNSKTAMIAMISPAIHDYEESICTLRYAARVKYIQNHAKINVEQRGLIESFEHEIADLQAKIQMLQLSEQPRRRHRTADSLTKSEELRKCEEEIEHVEQERNDLMQRIAMMQKKILIGGENLFEKVQQQAFLIETSGTEIQNLDRNNMELEEALNRKENERIDVEEQYSSLQEEDVGLNKKIRKVQAYLNEMKEVHADKEHEHQREIETLLDNNRLLVREMQLATLIIDTYIPNNYLKKIEENLIWNVETQEYQLKGVAYTGNNMRKQQSLSVECFIPVRYEMKPVYHKYPVRKRERKLEKRSFSAVPTRC